MQDKQLLGEEEQKMGEAFERLAIMHQGSLTVKA